MGNLSVVFLSRILALSCVVALSGCASEALSTDPGKKAEPPGPPVDTDLVVASLLGEDGSGPPTFFTVYDPSDDTSGRPLLPSALAWNPVEQDELWITLREPPTDRTCNRGGTVACTWLIGRVAIVHGATSAPAVPHDVETKEDANAWHFMRRPSAIAFGTDGTFATCGEARTGNYENEEASFIGPTLWSADPAIFGARPPADSPTGSTHIDMLHETPFCMGIAHESENAYWVFNGEVGALDRYDFHAPHAPGEDDHSDGELRRYVEGQLTRVPDVPSHLAYDSQRRLVYAADTGHGRVVSLDATSGHEDGKVTAYEPLVAQARMSGATLVEVVPPGLLAQPSGLTLYRGVLFVTDYASSRIVAFDRAGRRLVTVETGLPTGSLGGIAIGPDGRAYLVDRSTRRVLRLEPSPASE